LARQYFRYGQGRARTLLKHRRFIRLRPALPFLGLVSWVVTAIVEPRLALAGAVTYAVGTGVEAARVSRGQATAPGVTWLAFPTMHASHALGFGLGLIRFRLKPNW
jgi:hypothetical protein